MTRRPRTTGPKPGKPAAPLWRSPTPYVMGVLLGFAAAGVAVIFAGNGDGPAPRVQVVQQQMPGRTPQEAAAPWYRNQRPPPALIKIPDEPIRLILPEEVKPQPGVPPRAYEEALPETVYRPPPLPAPAPIAKQVARSAPRPPPPPAVAGLPPVSPVIAPAVRPVEAAPIPAWQANAVRVAANSPLPAIALVIDDAGVDQKRTARTIGLPGPLTISFLTYAPALKRQTRAARTAGHELMVHVSMEPSSKSVDPGPRVLLTGMAEDEVLARLRWGLARFSGYVGINNHMGSRFTSAPAGMRVVLAEVKRRGLFFLDSRTSLKSVGRQLAIESKTPFAERNVFLDHDPRRAVIERQFKLLEREARGRGYAVAIGHPRDATLDALADWLPTVAEKGFRLVPMSAIVARRQGVKLAQKGR